MYSRKIAGAQTHFFKLVGNYLPKFFKTKIKLFKILIFHNVTVSTQLYNNQALDSSQKIRIDTYLIFRHFHFQALLTSPSAHWQAISRLFSWLSEKMKLKLISYSLIKLLGSLVCGQAGGQAQQHFKILLSWQHTIKIPAPHEDNLQFRQVPTLYIYAHFT